ncbi:MAG: polyprenyl synthetase family protein [Planctomycetes bacterium]|nr:polyprenyl synthetase family protein [Planctomycetota bacterium]
MKTTIDDLRGRLKELLNQDRLMSDIFPLAGDLNRAKFSRGRLLVKIAEDNGLDIKDAIEAAMGLEMVHMASLVHDDVIDDSDLRRNQKSFKSLKGNKGAILFGDYLFSAAVRQIQETQSADCAKLFTKCVHDTCRGESIQDLILSEENQNTGLDLVLEAAKGKTGALFSYCTEAPALMKGLNKDLISKIGRIGLLSGLGFQLADDILDICGDESDLGKPSGNDLVKNCMTTPLFLLMQEEQKGWIEFQAQYCSQTDALKQNYIKSESSSKLSHIIHELHAEVLKYVEDAENEGFVLRESINLFWEGLIFKRMLTFKDLTG